MMITSQITVLIGTVQLAGCCLKLVPIVTFLLSSLSDAAVLQALQKIIWFL